MATQFPRVNPGNVITAAQWNQVLAALEDIYSQIGAVSTTAVAITGFVPPGPVKGGDPLTIQGRNFDFSVGGLRLFFDNVAINAFKLGSSDTQLLVDVPDVGALPPQGRLVAVTAHNRVSNDQKFLTVVPVPIPLTGRVAVGTPTFTGTPAAGQTTNFAFPVTSGLSLSRALTLTPTLTPQAWQNLVQLLGTNQRPISGGQVTLDPNQSSEVFLSLPIPAGTANGTPFTVQLDVFDALSGANVGTSGAKAYALGQASQDDPNVQFGQISLFDFAPPGQVNVLSGNTIHLAPNSTAIISVSVTFKAAAQYTASAVTSASGWGASMNLPANGQFDFRSAVPPPQDVQFKITTGSTPISGGTVVFKVGTLNQTLATSASFTLTTG